MHEVHRRIVGNVAIPDHEHRRLAQQLSNGTATVVSGGGAEDGLGCSGWKIAHRNNRQQRNASGSNVCDGSRDGVDSYRTELHGILGGLLFATTLLECHNLPMDNVIKLYCGNVSALRAVREGAGTGTTVRDTLAPEWDLKRTADDYCLSTDQISIYFECLPLTNA